MMLSQMLKKIIHQFKAAIVQDLKVFDKKFHAN